MNMDIATFRAHHTDLCGRNVVHNDATTWQYAVGRLAASLPSIDKVRIPKSDRPSSCLCPVEVVS